MKKKLTALLTALLCLNGSVFAFSANAAEANDVLEKTYSYSTDTFSYTSNGDRGFTLETELVDAQFMVVAVLESMKNPGETADYLVTPINHSSQGLGMIYNHVAFDELGMELQVGDLIRFDGFDGLYETLDYTYPIYLPIGYTAENEKKSMVHLGNGMDIFGEDFANVIRIQMVLEQEVLDDYFVRYPVFTEIHPNLTIVKGDVNVDDEITILDCLALNRNLLIGEPLCDYAKSVADINGNGAPDSGDALAILKECVELTENFE